MVSGKGGLIPESFSSWLKSPKLGAKSLSTNRKDAKVSNLASIFGELSHRKNISETKLPLAGLFVSEAT